MTTRTRRGPWAALRPLALAAVGLLLAGCLGDGPVPPEVQPLEVVLGPETCILNVPEVAAGMHSVLVVHELGDSAGSEDGAVRFLDPGGTVLFEGQTGEHMASDPVRLDEGTYRVERSPDTGKLSSATLRVNPAPQPRGTSTMTAVP